MVEKKVNVQNKLGIHARPAALLVRTASKFESEIFIVKGGQEVNGKSIMGVMALAAEFKSEITIRANGEDEEKAVDKIVQLFFDKFEED
jgi:phosphocarrier protein HPr